MIRYPGAGLGQRLLALGPGGPLRLSGQASQCPREEPRPLREVAFMPRSKQLQRERTHDWPNIRHYTLWPEQTAYALLRPVVLFHESAAERAKESGTAERTLHRKAEQFELLGQPVPQGTRIPIGRLAQPSP